jgi:hypothetical protein
MVKNILNSSNKTKITNNVKSLLFNKYILYFICIIAVGNLVYLGMSNDLSTIAVFVLVGFLTSFFSKNMIVILSISLAVSGIIKYGTSISQYEGVENFDINNMNLKEVKENMENVVDSLMSLKEISKKKTTTKGKKSNEDKTNTESKDLDTFVENLKGNTISNKNSIISSKEDTEETE